MPISDYVRHIDETVKRDDIRGIYGQNLDAGYARALGRSLAEILRAGAAVGPTNVVVGHDMRLSGPVLAEGLCEGLAEGGCRPIRMGLSGTELVGFLAAHHGDLIDGGVMVTASHNPPDNNGFKFFGRHGLPLPLAVEQPAEAGGSPLQRMALSVKKSRVPSRLRWEDFAPDYIQTAVQRGGLDFEEALRGAKRPLRVGVEAGNGMGARIMREFARIGPEFEWTFSNETPDGRFPKVVPNPLKADYQEMVADLVEQSRSDIGICFDGDADRVGLADENGKMIDPPFVAALVGQRLQQKLGPKAKVAFNLECSWAIADTLGDRQEATGEGTAVMVPVGYNRIKAIMHRNKDIAFGAEHSGHYLFRDFYTADSGMLAGLTVLELAAELHSRNKALSSVVEKMRTRYQGSGEHDFELHDERTVDEVIAEAVETFRDEAVRIYVVTEDGVRSTESYPPPFDVDASAVRLEADNWWFCVRQSGTETGVGRLYVEADANRKLMENKFDILAGIVGEGLER